MNAGNFTLSDPTPSGKNTEVTFYEHGRLNTTSGDGTWELKDHRTVVMNFGDRALPLEMKANNIG